MNNFIAHFDILGYKEFIQNNDKAYVDHHNSHIFRESQLAVSKDGAYVDVPGGYAADVRTSEINCLHISDTILFWTNTATENDFLKLVLACQKFYSHCLQTAFAIRGAIGFGDFEFTPFQIAGQGNAMFYNSSLYGKGLVETYLAAENQDWAGAFIDESAINAKDAQGAKIVSDNAVNQLIYDRVIAYYGVPLKDGTKSYKHCLRLFKGGLNNTAFRNYAMRIEQQFKAHMNGKPLPSSVIKKVQNTIEFLDYLRSEFYSEQKNTPNP